MGVVIVGGGLAGLRVAEGLCNAGYADNVTVISSESEMPYNRPPLSKELLWGATSADRLRFGVSASAEDVAWRLGTPVVSADLDRRVVEVDGGEEISYDGLVIASGVSSRRLNLTGPRAGRVVLRTLADAKALQESLIPGARVVILGAGFIGCEVALTARKLGCEVDVVAIDRAPMLMPLGETVGSEIRRRHEEAGIRFHLGRSIVSLSGTDALDGVMLDDGTELPADLLLESIGSMSHTAWLDGNDLDLSNGVLCDPFLRAGGRSGVVAVGDVARFANPAFDAPPQRIEHWQTAVDTAKFATATLLADLGIAEGEPLPASIVPWFWSDQGELQLTSYGMLGLADSIEVLEGDLSGECAVAYRRSGKPVGILLMGLKTKGARYKRWLVDQRR